MKYPLYIFQCGIQLLGLGIVRIQHIQCDEPDGIDFVDPHLPHLPNQCAIFTKHQIASTEPFVDPQHHRNEPDGFRFTMLGRARY